MDTNLSIKITALVQGLQEVAALSQGFLKAAEGAGVLGKAGTGLDKAFDDMGESVEGLGKKTKSTVEEMDAAFRRLGGRSIATIQKEIDEINEALENVKKSGASFQDIERASDLAAARIRVLNQEMSAPAPKTFAQRLEDIGQKLREADFKGAAVEVNNLTQGLGGMAGIVGRAAVAFVAFKAIGFLKDLVSDAIAFGQEAAKASARAETLGVTLGVVATNGGYSAQTISGLEANLKKLGITTEATRDSLIKMIQAGIPINQIGSGIEVAGRKLTIAEELARRAQDLAVVSGENSSQTLQRMVTNIQQMDTMGLRFMGLTVSREAAEARMAQSLNKTVDALSQKEKQQAFLNATMVEAAKLEGAYEKSMDTAGKKQASLKRYVDEYALSIGNLLLPAYGAIVDAQTAFYKEATKNSEVFSKNSQSAQMLGGSLKSLSLSLAGLFAEGISVGLEIFESLTRAMKQASNLVSPLVGGLKTVVDVLDDFGKSSFGLDNFVAKLNPISGLINGLALVLAVVRDAAVLTFASAVNVVGRFQEALALVVQGVGYLASIVNEDLGKSITDFGNSMRQTGKDMQGWSNELITGVLEGQGALGEFANSFGKVNDKVGASNKVFSELSKQIEQMNAAQSAGNLSAEAMAKTYDGVSEALIKARDSGEITAQQFVELTRQADIVPGAIASRFRDAAAEAGTSINQLRSDLSKQTAAGIEFMGALIEGAVTKNVSLMESMGTSSEKIGQDILAVYEKYAEGAKTMSELVTLSAKLDEARRGGLLSEKEYQEALSITTAQFNKLFEAQLKSADSKRDFDLLTESVEKLYEAGKITEVQYDRALQLIAEKASGAQASVKKLAEQTRELSEESLKLAQTRLDVVRAETDVMRSRVDVWVAEAKYAQTGNELDRLGVEIARLDLAVAEEQLKLQRLKAKEQQANYDLAIAKQRLLNAETALQYDRTNSGLQQAAIQAQQVVDAQELGVEALKAQVNSQSEQVLKAQEAQYWAKGMYEVLKLQDEQVKSVARSTGSAGQAMGALGAAAAGATSSFGSMGPSMQAVAGHAGTAKSEVVGFGSALGTARVGVDSVATSFRGVNEVMTQTNRLYADMISNTDRWSVSVQQAYAKSMQVMQSLDTAQRGALEATTGLNYGSGNYNAAAGSLSGYGGSSSTGSGLDGQLGYMQGTGGSAPGYSGNMRLGPGVELPTGKSNMKSQPLVQAGGYQMKMPPGEGWSFQSDQRATGGISPQQAIQGSYPIAPTTTKVAVNGVGYWVRSQQAANSSSGGSSYDSPFGGYAGSSQQRADQAAAKAKKDQISQQVATVSAEAGLSVVGSVQSIADSITPVSVSGSAATERIEITFEARGTQATLTTTKDQKDQLMEIIKMLEDEGAAVVVGGG